MCGIRFTWIIRLLPSGFQVCCQSFFFLLFLQIVIEDEIQIGACEHDRLGALFVDHALIEHLEAVTALDQVRAKRAY